MTTRNIRHADPYTILEIQRTLEKDKHRHSNGNLLAEFLRESKILASAFSRHNAGDPKMSAAGVFLQCVKCAALAIRLAEEGDNSFAYHTGISTKLVDLLQLSVRDCGPVDRRYGSSEDGSDPKVDLAEHMQDGFNPSDSIPF